MLLDDDMDFRRRFSDYLAVNCSHVSLLLADGRAGGNLPIWLRKKPDLVLVDAGSAILEELIAVHPGNHIVVLLPSESDGRKMDDQGIRYVFKYSRASSLIASIPELAGGMDEVRIMRNTGDSMMLAAITGFCGGCGRTSFAVMLARLNRKLQDRIALLISTERYPDIDVFFPETDGFVSDSNLLLLNQLSGLRVQPSRFLLQDDCGIFTLSPPSEGSSDINDLDEDDMADFLECIREWDMFDSVIFDTGMGDHALDRFLYNNADQVFMVHDARRPRTGAERRWMEQLYQSAGRTSFMHVVNYSITPSGEGASGWAQLPDDPDSFRQRNGKTEILMTGRYAESVGRLLTSSECLL